jgi:hypothetical protein
VDVGCEVADCCCDAGVQRAAVREVAAEAHAGCADSAGAGFEVFEEVDGEGGVFIVGGELFFNLGM